MSQIDMSQYKKDARGNLVPIANIRPIDLLRDELVQKITARARAVQEELQEYRRQPVRHLAGRQEGQYPPAQFRRPIPRAAGDARCPGIRRGAGRGQSAD